MKFHIAQWGRASNSQQVLRSGTRKTRNCRPTAQKTKSTDEHRMRKVHKFSFWPTHTEPCVSLYPKAWITLSVRPWSSRQTWEEAKWPVLEMGLVSLALIINLQKPAYNTLRKIPVPPYPTGQKPLLTSPTSTVLVRKIKVFSRTPYKPHSCPTVARHTNIKTTLVVLAESPSTETQPSTLPRPLMKHGT